MSERQIYFHDWETGGESEMLSDFRADPSVLEGVTVLIASYTYADYNGDAFVIFVKDDEFYEIHGSHCSCYGLEDDGWSPEKTTKEALLARLEKGTWGEEEKLTEQILDAVMSWPPTAPNLIVSSTRKLDLN